MVKKIKKAVFPVAGFGTRFLPFTKAIPKEMLPILHKPAIQILAEEAAESGIEQIVIVTGRGKRAIEDHFDSSFELEFLLEKKNKKDELKAIKKVENLAKFIFVRQPEPLGDGHAVLCAREVIGNNPFAVIFGDNLIKSDRPALRQLIDLYEIKGESVIGVQEVPKKDVSKFGIVKPKKEGESFEIEEMVEKPSLKKAPSNLGILGKYVCVPEIFDALETAEKSHDGELRLIDGFRKLQQTKPIFGKIIVGQGFDIGDKFGFLQATVDAALSEPSLRDDFLEYLKKKLG